MFKKLLGLFQGDKKSEHDLPPEVRAVFDRMASPTPDAQPGTACLMCGGPRGAGEGLQCKTCTAFMRDNANNSIHGCGGCGAGFVVAPNTNVYAFATGGVDRVMCACCQEYLRSRMSGGNMPMPKMGGGYDAEGQDINRRFSEDTLKEKLGRRAHQRQLWTLVTSKAHRTGVPIPAPMLLPTEE